MALNDMDCKRLLAIVNGPPLTGIRAQWEEWRDGVREIAENPSRSPYATIHSIAYYAWAARALGLEVFERISPHACGHGSWSHARNGKCVRCFQVPPKVARGRYELHPDDMPAVEEFIRALKAARALQERGSR